jgi:hypothetical protein
VPCVHCARPLAPEVCLALLPPRGPAREALEATLVERVAMRGVQLRYCANPRCAAPFEYVAGPVGFGGGRGGAWSSSSSDDWGAEEEAPEALAVTCPLCGLSTCVLCAREGHVGRECRDTAVMVGTSAGGDGTDGEDGVVEAEELLRALASRKGWKPCPTCSRITSKDSSWSCNYSVCMCGTAFCFQCGVPYKTGDQASSSSADPRANDHGVARCDCGLY